MASLIEVSVNVPGAAYVVTLGEGALDRIGELVAPPATGQRAAVVADGTTAALFGARVTASLAGAGWQPHLVTVPPGEASKTLRSAERLYEECAAAGLDRGSTVFALGGGVVGDLAGFVAATYLRGIALVQVPTTLLAQVDSSVGGKVGVDLPRAKNLVGAFHQPVAVIADPATLCSLPPRELAAGLAEVVKHAAIADAELFRQIETQAPALLALDLGVLTEIVACNCRIKASVVALDPLERSGLRAVLNYGHTIGHAIERAAASWGVLHGEAVAVGMVAEAKMAAELGLSGSAVADRLGALLSTLGLPIAAPRERIEVERAESALRSDKKIVGGRLALPVVSEIGRAELIRDVPVEALLRGLHGALR